MWSFLDKCASLASSIPREKLTNEFPRCNVCVTLKFTCSHGSSYRHKTSAEETLGRKKMFVRLQYFGIFQKKHEKALDQCIHGHRIIPVLCKGIPWKFSKKINRIDSFLLRTFIFFKRWRPSLIQKNAPPLAMPINLSKVCPHMLWKLTLFRVNF